MSSFKNNGTAVLLVLFFIALAAIVTGYVFKNLDSSGGRNPVVTRFCLEGQSTGTRKRSVTLSYKSNLGDDQIVLKNDVEGNLCSDFDSDLIPLAVNRATIIELGAPDASNLFIQIGTRVYNSAGKEVIDVNKVKIAHNYNSTYRYLLIKPKSIESIAVAELSREVKH